MFRAQVDCIGCHQGAKRDEASAEVLGQTFVAAQKRCDYCHGDRYAGKLDEWKQIISTQQTDKADAAYAQAKTAVDAAAAATLSCKPSGFSMMPPTTCGW